MADALDGLDAARRAGWARAFDAEEVAANMLFELYITSVMANDFFDRERRVGNSVRDWMNAASTERGWVDGTTPPPHLTPGQVEARIRIARRFLELDGRTVANWTDPRPPPE